MIRETSIVHPDGSIYDFQLDQRQDGVYTITATLRGTEAMLRGWAHSRQDADRIFATFAEWIVAGDVELTPQPRWRRVLGEVWDALTFQPDTLDDMRAAFAERGLPNMTRGPIPERKP